MNLLKYRNRFDSNRFQPGDVYKITGYMEAMRDFISYLLEVTESKPEKRMVDSVDILQSITETNIELDKIRKVAEAKLSDLSEDPLKAKLAGVDLGSDKVKQFLKEP
jgi:hypothetical protein